MSRFNGFLRWAWSIIIVGTLAFALGGCEGSDGAAGAAGAAGGAGPAGPVGPEGPPGAVPDVVAAAIESANAESCSTCHDGAGDGHQATYDMYDDASDLTLTFNDVISTVNLDGTFTATVYFSVTKDGSPLADLNVLDYKRFIATRYDATAGQYLEGGKYFGGWAADVNVGDFTAVNAVLPFDPKASDGMIYGYIADENITPGDVVPGKHITLYDDVASDVLAYGAAVEGATGSYVSAANSDQCGDCHGTPYMKHGNRVATLEGIPDFAACKTCHYDDRSGGHEDWQYMVDDPLGWATDAPATADYSYTANVMNDTHMSHAMEFPYPQSMANCATCHEGKLGTILTDANFTTETCKSCHVVDGIDAQPGEAYAQSHRAPPLRYLWDQSIFPSHDINSDCSGCHTAGGIARAFNVLHSGYDATIYNAAGEKYADLNTVSVTNVTRSGDLLTVTFTATNPVISPTLAISFYGWDTKHFIIPAHERDGNGIDCPHSSRPGCNIEWSPGSTKPFFTEESGSVAGAWSVTFDMSLFQAVKTNPIPQLIADGEVTMAEITILPRLVVGTDDVVLEAVSTSYDLGGSLLVEDYFQGANAVVDIDKCNDCHDTLGSTFHAGRGRGGDSMQACKVCHATTFPGSHLEMASRSIDSYVHAIHSFQQFDLDDVANESDPDLKAVLTARKDLHINHTFPNFTIVNCEGCHLPGTYNVPDQSKSMPGVLSASSDIADRNIGTVPEYVTGPASRSCGGCHRADLINADLAGDLASFNAHTDAFGTLEENDDEDLVLFGIIDKIMSMFQ